MIFNNCIQTKISSAWMNKQLNTNYKQEVKQMGKFCAMNKVWKSSHNIVTKSDNCLTPKGKNNQQQHKIPKFIRHNSQEDLKIPLKNTNNCKKNIFFGNQPSGRKEGKINKQDQQYENPFYTINIKSPLHSPKNEQYNLKDTTSTGVCESKIINSKSPSFIKDRIPTRVKSQKHFTNLTIDNFKLLKKLGEGRFGKVYLAKEIETEIVVALKILNKRKIKQQNLLNQLIRQIKIQAFLNHPNIVQLYGFFYDEDNFYIIMELGSDGHLYRLLETNQPLTQQTTSYITKNLLSAVNELHKHRVIHRDIKPQNIVLIHGNVKLCDFGWAVQKKQQLRTTFCGTPLYLSPQLLSGQMYNQKVDLWAIGILSYELHMGQSPFKIMDKAQLYKIITDEVIFPERPIVSKQFKQFIRSILKKDPNERKNCQQLLKTSFIKKYEQLETCQQLCH